MFLTPGTRLGPYEVLTQIGVGGMGEVYKATDTNLKRQVAIKVLPASVAGDVDRLTRFQREAEVLAALNHPNIAQIYGLQKSDGTIALVLELVEGPTLADRIAQGAIPVDEALPFAKQIAEALESAHEQGIIHRDLKPANIKLRPDGTVKVLDFGLAKALEPVAARVDATASPTITSPAMMTGVGVLLGTAAYMSPEQAKGHPADKRSDVWAFGAVLYEMLAGRRAFDGEDMTEVLGAVVRLEPKWDALPNDVPSPIRMLVQRCLVKDRRRRITDIAAALFVLEHHTGLAAAGTALSAVVRRTPQWRRVGGLAGVVLGVAAATGSAVWFATRPVPPSVVRTALTASGSAALSLHGSDRDIVITPDGSRVVYRGNNQLLVRRLDELEPTVLSGLGAPRGVFISPDGQWVGFSDDTTIKKVAITGGPPVTIASVGRVPRGATWGPDETIIFSTGISATGLQRVSAAGGEPTVLTKPDRGRGEGLHVWPEFLPGGGAVLFTIASASEIENEAAQIAVLDLQTGMSKVLIRNGSHAHYVPTGHLVYGFAGTLRAVAFDLGRREVVGTPTPVLDGVVTTALGAADVAVAANGSLVYVRGSAPGGDQQTLVSVDRQGRGVPLPGLPPGSLDYVRVSPDGARLALATQDDVWIYEFARATTTRLTTDPARDRSPVWTPDGQRVVFTSQRAGYHELFSRSADGTGRDERLLTRAKDLVDLRASSWSREGRLLFIEVTEVPPRRQSAVWQIALERPSDAKVLLRSAFSNDHASVSPDGRWMAYTSNVSGRNEIYVERYPELGNRQLISTGGGRLPLWSRDGSELFFTQDGRQMLAVPIRSGTTLDAGPPKVLFEFAIGASPIGSARPYDIAPDGRFLIIGNAGAETGRGTEPSMIVVQNWFEELKRLVPTN